MKVWAQSGAWKQALETSFSHGPSGSVQAGCCGFSVHRHTPSCQMEWRYRCEGHFGQMMKCACNSYSLRKNGKNDDLFYLIMRLSCDALPCASAGRTRSHLNYFKSGRSKGPGKNTLKLLWNFFHALNLMYVLKLSNTKFSP